MPRRVRLLSCPSCSKLAARLALAACTLLVSSCGRPAPVEWPFYGGPLGQRYSPLDQINRSNVSRLRVAWSYDTADGSGGLQTHPLVVDGVLYANTPRHKVIALDAATGALRWRFDPGIEGRGPNRGVAYWAAGRDRRIFAGVMNFVYALDARDGKPIPAFGRQGRIDLREGLGRDPEQQSIVLTSPGVVYKDLLIVGGRTSEGLPASPGDIRAYDTRTGTLRWSFHTIPHPGEFGYETWPKDAWTYIGSANNWAGMVVDQERGVVYAPTGSAASDFYGANRAGDNLFANSLVALDAATGRRIWHFQLVKHDIWDRDFPSPPTLLTVKRAGRDVEAVAVTTKHGYVLVFDRASGQPLFPMEDKKYPPSDVEGEVTAETQPLPVKPAPFARQLLTEDMLTTRTPAAHRAALEQFRKFRSGGQYIPLSVGKETVVFPGFDGGAEWGGSAFDPATGLLYVNANEMAWTSSLAPAQAGASGRQVYLNQCAICHRDDMTGSPPQMPSLVGLQQQFTPESMARLIRQGAGRMPGSPNLSREAVEAVARFVLSGESRELAGSSPSPLDQKYRFTGYHKFLDPDGYPAISPPWGTLTAIDLNTGEHAWQIPLGEFPELAAQGLANTGTENYGGPIVTAGGIVFIGATNYDKKFRAFDSRTGKLLWETTLPFAGNATPVTYEAGGRQFVAIAAGGGKARGAASGGVYVAFALPDDAGK